MMSIDFEKIWSDVEASKIDSMTVPEYKNYILAFLFYRFLCENQENYLIDSNVLEVSEDQSINDVYASEASGDEMEDYLDDISASLGYAVEPADTWATLVNKIEDCSVKPSDYQTIFENFDKNAMLNKEAERNFRGIFDDVNLGDQRLGGDTTARARSLGSIVKVVAGFEYDGEIGTLFKGLIERFATSAGKTGGKFYTPDSVSKIMARIVADNVDESDVAFTVLDPACGSGSTLLALTDEIPGGSRPGAIKYYGQEKELTTYNLVRMNLLLNGASYSNIILNNHDTLATDWPDGPDERGFDHPRAFDAVVSDIEFSKEWNNEANRLKDARFKDYGKLAPKTKADYAFILHGLYHLNEEGTMAVVLPHGVLFRGGAEGVIRKNLIEHPSGNRIHAVIGLPENIMFAEKGKKSVAVTIVVFKKKRMSNDILFIDASRAFERGKNRNSLSPEHINEIINAYHNRENIDRYAHLATLQEVRKNEYNLNIPRYVSTFEEEPEIDLDEVNRLLDEDDLEIATVKAQVEAAFRDLGLNRYDVCR